MCYKGKNGKPSEGRLTANQDSMTERVYPEKFDDRCNKMMGLVEVSNGLQGQMYWRGSVLYGMKRSRGSE